MTRVQKYQLHQTPGASRKPAMIPLDDSTQSDSDLPRKPSKAARKNRNRKRSPSSLSIESLGWQIFHFCFDILGRCLSLIKWPIAIALVYYFSAFVVNRSYARIQDALATQAKLAICSVPVTNRLTAMINPNFCKFDARGEPVDFQKVIDLQISAMDAVPTYTGSMSLQLKKAEMATNDLRTVIKLSDMACKDSLDVALRQFSENSRVASREVTRTVVKVGSMIDSSLAINEHALSALERVQTRGFMENVFPSFAKYDSRTQITTAYINTMNALSDYLARLIAQNQFAYEALDKLEEDLFRINDIVSLEKMYQKSSQDDILSSLWSTIGGNKRQKATFANNLAVLSEFERGRGASKEVVINTINAFETMMAQVEEIRERVARPGLADEYDIPIEVHIRSIQMGIDRLRENKEQSSRRLASDSTDVRDVTPEAVKEELHKFLGEWMG